jgi:hypothetical protein
MPGLDPGIHDAAQQSKPYVFFFNGLMDCRVKPGNDEREAH